MSNALSDEYYYLLEKFKIEDKMSKIALDFLRHEYPNAEIVYIPSFTKDNRETEDDQCNHIDCKVYIDEIEYHYDFKCLDADYYNCVIIELQRRKDYNWKPGKIKRGWIEGNGLIPLDRQYILQVTRNQIIEYNKFDVYRVINKYKNYFNPNKLQWRIDGGTKPEDLAKGNILYKRNKYLFFNKSDKYNNDFSIKILREMHAKKYHLCEGKWFRVDITETYNIRNCI